MNEKENQLLALRDNAQSQLAQIKTLEEGTDFLDRVKALEAYARATKQDAEMVKMIQEQKIRSMRILGKLLEETEFDKGTAGTLNGRNSSGGFQVKPLEASNNKPRLSDLGISKKESHTYQTIAAIPEEDFNDAIAAAHQTDSAVAEITVKDFYSAGKKAKREKASVQHQRKVEKLPPANVRLIEGDLFDVIDQIPDNSVDLLNTDPPYMVLGEDWDTFKSKDDFMDFTRRWLEAVMPKVKSTGRVYISFSQWYQYDFYDLLRAHDFFGFKFAQTIIWYYKNNNQPSNRKEYRYMYEPIFYLYGHEAPVLNFTPDTYGETQQNVWEIATPQSNFKEGKFHPAQKPIELYDRIIKTGSYDGATVLDCFAGSGTTGIVCRDLKRNCILIERDVTNLETIKQRL